MFKQYIKTIDRFIYVKQIIDILKTDVDNYTYVDLLTMRMAKDYCFKIPYSDKLIYVIVKPIDKRSLVNSHEFLTAALVLLGITESPSSQQDLLDIYSNIANNIVKCSKIKNYTFAEVNSIEYDYTSVCQAISASKVILDTLKNIPQIAYLTGTNKWDDDIKHLKTTNTKFKNYNSSDIVFKYDNNLYGVSLKRKELLSDKDPPILNKSLLNLFGGSIKVNLENIISDYFISALNELMEQQVLTEHSNKNNWKKIISELNISIINNKIKDDKCIIWKNVRKIISKNSKVVCTNILEHMLKLELLTLKNSANFSFFIVTGTGRHRKNKGFIVENGEIISLEKILDVYNTHIKNKKISIKRNKEDESKFQSTLFLTIYADTLPIINLETRYKGRFHTSPEILAFFTKEFKKLLNK